MICRPFWSHVIGIVVCMSALSGCQALSKGSFGEFKRSLNTRSYGYEIVADFTGQAPVELIEKFEVKPGDCNGEDCRRDRERSELSGSKDNYRNSTHWYGWWIYVPMDYPNVFPTKAALGQFHQTGSTSLAPAFMFQNRDGGYWIDRNFGSTSHEIQLIPADDFRGKWHQIEVHAKWHTRDGFFTVYVNGEPAWHFEGETMSSGARSIYFKYGVYRSFMSRYQNSKGVDEVPAQTVFFANVKRAKSREGLAAPPG